VRSDHGSAWSIHPRRSSSVLQANALSVYSQTRMSDYGNAPNKRGGCQVMEHEETAERRRRMKRFAEAVRATSAGAGFRGADCACGGAEDIAWAVFHHHGSESLEWLDGNIPFLGKFPGPASYSRAAVSDRVRECLWKTRDTRCSPGAELDESIAEESPVHATASPQHRASTEFTGSSISIL